MIEDAGNGSARKSKLTKPPVKVACLACRASRTRCDGRSTCTSCLAKNKQCSYTKSMRGGPRVAGKKAPQKQEQPHEPLHPVLHRENGFKPLESAERMFEDPAVHTFDQFPENISSHQQDLDVFQQPYDGNFWDLVVPMISPGAGLKDLDSDQIFDSLFGTSTISSVGSQPKPSVGMHSHTPPYSPISRVYGSNGDILNAYYIFIHPYFPILSPPESPLVPDTPLVEEPDGFEPSSPISLALSAVLSLIPHPNDVDPTNQESQYLRRKKAHLFAQLAMESIEIEAEILASVTSPGEALSSDPSSFRREPFHTKTPIELESVLAYLVLSIYEYAQRGNIAKMRNRGSQAYDAATRLSLQEAGEANMHWSFEEARRRAWWMTYVVVLQGSIVSSTAPIIPVDYRQFGCPLPTTTSDSEAWPAFLDAQQLILKCTQFTVALKKTLQAGSDLSAIQDRIVSLDNEIDALIGRYSWSLDPPSTAPVEASEFVLAKSLKAQAQIKLNSARIKLHRYRAFQDVPIFTRRHCDLERADPGALSGQLGCSCSSSFLERGSNKASQQSTPPAFDPSRASSASSSSASSSPSVDSETSPFSSLQSAKVCMKAALNISRAFEALPYPNTTQMVGSLAPTFLSDISLTSAPRTMPAFACCAMQSSYALLMLCQKSRDFNRNSTNGLAFQNGLEELYTGLQRVLDALRNYSIAFEALGGMRSK